MKRNNFEQIFYLIVYYFHHRFNSKVMKNTLLFLMLLISVLLTAQESGTNNSSSIMFHFGRNIHGTGDIPGYQYGITYSKNFSKNIYYSIGFEGSLNDAEQRSFIYEDPEGNLFDGTLNDVTGGFQLVASIGYSFIKTTHSDFGVSVGALGRYQTTSIGTSVEILYPPITGYPIPIRMILNDEPYRTLAFGGVLKLNYNYTFKKGFILGLMPGFQIDTNGDTLPYITLGIGKQF